MKTSERRHLKENELAQALADFRDRAGGYSRQFMLLLVGVLLVAGVAAGYVIWRQQRNEKAAALLAEARSVADAPIAAPAADPKTPAAPVPANSFPTEAARNQAALARFQSAAAAYPSTGAGIAARYQAASLFAEMGKLAEAEKEFQEVVRRDGTGLYGRMAKLGIAEVQLRTSRFDPAIQTLQELSRRSDTDLPVDGILMQLGDAYRRAGRLPEAVGAYTRIIEEFPASPYVTDARAEVDRLKTAASAGPPRA
jgi:predicted negative regulator of RcsB-dependent stress response